VGEIEAARAAPCRLRRYWELRRLQSLRDQRLGGAQRVGACPASGVEGGGARFTLAQRRSRFRTP
jgi:hypothetical protein